MAEVSGKTENAGGGGEGEEGRVRVRVRVVDVWSSLRAHEASRPALT